MMIHSWTPSQTTDLLSGTLYSVLPQQVILLLCMYPIPILFRIPLIPLTMDESGNHSFTYDFTHPFFVRMHRIAPSANEKKATAINRNDFLWPLRTSHNCRILRYTIYPQYKYEGNKSQPRAHFQTNQGLSRLTTTTAEYYNNILVTQMKETKHDHVLNNNTKSKIVPIDWFIHPSIHPSILFNFLFWLELWLLNYYTKYYIDRNSSTRLTFLGATLSFYESSAKDSTISPDLCQQWPSQKEHNE